MPRPIVLCHGIARFDEIFATLGKDLYFKGIPEELGAAGFDAYRAHVDFAGSVVKRSRQLKQQLMEILADSGFNRAHLIAHSMGGLDARHMIVDEDMAGRVASLTTIGTPHRGTSFADVGLSAAGDVIDVVGVLGLDLDGFRDLSTAACAAFNQRAEEAEARNGVVYHVYSSFQDKPQVVAPLKASWQIIHNREGDNDGLVPVTSQEWTATLRAGDGTEKTVARHRFPFGADHLNQVGSWDPSELRTLNFFRFLRRARVRRYEQQVRALYVEIAQRVTAGD